MNKQTKLHSVVSIAVILAFLYPTASLIPVDLTFLTTLPSKIAAAFAEKPKPEKVELKDQRTENSKTYLNPNGTYTTEISQQPINYEDDGQLKPIDTSLAKDTDGYKVDKNSLQVDFDNKSSNLLQMTNSEDNTSINYKVADSNKTQITPVKKSDNELSYDNYKDGASLNYKVQAGKVKEEIILDKPPADNTFTFELNLKGLKPEQQKDDSIHLVNQKDKTSIIIEKPFMKDSHQDAPPDLFLSYNIEMQIKPKQGSNYILTLTADKAWLEDPKRVYPVKIDPTFVVQNRPAEDTLIYQAWPDTAFSGLDKLYVGGWSDTQQMKTLIKYDLSNIPKDAVISSAQLNNFNAIYDDYLSNLDLYDYKEATSTRLFRATANWNGSSTWNTMANNFDSSPVAQSTANNPGFDVTSLVKGWQSGQYQNYGVMLDNTSRITIIDDSIPIGSGDPFTDSWQWWTGQIHSGSRSHIEWGKAGYHRHLYANGAKFFVPAGSAIEAWVFPAAWDGGRPNEIMLQFRTTDGSWEHRAYWGASYIGWGIENTPSRQYAGPIPGYGSWQKLTTWSNWVGLDNQVIDGIAFSLYDGEAVFDEVYGWRKQVFHSSESATKDNAPRLVITYDLKRIGREAYKTYKEFSGASVDLHTGNLLVENTDLQIKGRGLPSTVTRTYNSQDSSTGIFAQGFRSYPDSLRINSNGPSVVVDTATGARHTYNQNADGSYQRPPGVGEDLIKNADGTFTLKRKDMSKVNFNAAGQAIEEIDKNNNKLTFSYGENGRISTILDAVGRQTTFTYNPDSTVAKITDFANRSTSYDYLNGRLTKVTNATGENTQYEYNTEGRLSAIINSLGNRTQITYNAQEMVESITNPLGKKMSFDYKTQSIRNNSGNLISNPSFESGLVGWNKFGNLNYAVYSDPSSPFGNNFMETNIISKDPNDSWFYDVPVTVKAGKTYTFSIYVRSPGGANISGTLALFALGPNQASSKQFSTDSKEWQRISTTFTVPYDSNTLRAQIYLANAGINYDFDGAQLEEGNIATQFEDSNYGYKPGDASYATVTDPNANQYTYYLTSEGLVTKTGEPMGPSVDYNAPEPDFPLDLTLEVAVNDEFGDFEDCFEDWEEDFTISDGECSADTDSNTEKVWDKAWEPTFAKENIPPPEVSQPLKAGSVIFYEYDNDYNLTKVINKDDTSTTAYYDRNGNKLSETNHDHSVPEKTIPSADYNNKHRTTYYSYDTNNNLTSQRSPTGKYTYYSYDANGNLIREQDPEGNVATYTYDQYGNQLTKTDPKGNQTLTPGDYTTTNSYDLSSNLIQTVDPEEVAIYYTYDASGNKLTEQKDGLAATEYTYDSLGRLLSQKNPPNTQGEYNLNKYYYDAAGNKNKDEVYEVKADGTQTLSSWFTYDYDASGQLTSQTNQIGAKTSYKYDNNGNKIEESKLINNTDPLNPVYSITTYEYDALNRITKETGPDGNWIAYKYDSFGNVVKEGTPEGTTVNLYDKAGNEVATASPDGSVTKAIYDKEGNERTTGDGRDKVTGLNYDANTNTSKVVDPKANETNYQYDGNQNEEKVISPTTQTLTNLSGTVTTSTDYNQANQVTLEQDQNQQDTTIGIQTSYNSSGQEATIQPPTNQNQSIAYDDAGNITEVKAVTDPNNPADLSTSSNIKNTYDAGGNPESVTTTSAVIGQTETKVNTTYDSANRITSLTDLLGRTINFEYDLAGNLIKLSEVPSPLGGEGQGEGGTTTYAYNTASKLTSLTDPNNKTTNFNYNLSGNLINTILPNSIQTNIDYDPASKINSLVNKQGSNTISDYRYTYDNNGNITNTAEPDGSTIYTYDSLNRLNNVVNKDASIVNYSYDEQGNRLTKEKQVVENGTLTTTEIMSYNYSAANELLSVLSSTGKIITYNYDANGNTLIKTDSSDNNQPITNYSYDNKNQLVKVKKEYPDSDIMPDKWVPANLVSSDGRSSDYAREGKYSFKIVAEANKYKRAVQRINSSGNAGQTLTLSAYTKTIGSSNTGGCIDVVAYLNNTDGTRTMYGLMFTKSPHDWLYRSKTITAAKNFSSIDVYVVNYLQTGTAYFDDLKLSGLGSNQLILQPSFELDSDNFDYVYDGNGNRFSKTITKANSQPVATFYHYDKDGNIVSETDKDNNLKVRYIRDTGGKAISMIQYDYSGQPSTVIGQRVYYFIYNGHGDVTALTDSTGAVVATYSYDEFGSQLTVDGRQMTDNGIYNPLRYSGAHNAYYDSETGLYKMGTRYYQPDVGRWLTRDDYTGNQKNLQTRNRYVYVENNPLTNADPTGFMSVSIKQALKKSRPGDIILTRFTDSFYGYATHWTHALMRIKNKRRKPWIAEANTDGLNQKNMVSNFNAANRQYNEVGVYRVKSGNYKNAAINNITRWTKQGNGITRFMFVSDYRNFYDGTNCTELIYRAWKDASANNIRLDNKISLIPGGGIYYPWMILPDSFTNTYSSNIKFVARGYK